MLNEHYVEMTKQESIIRKIFMYGRERAKVVGAENVFDFSLGNPSVPAPKQFDEALINLVKTSDSVSLHGYSPSLGNDHAREAIAESLNKRFGKNYTSANIFMAIGAAGALAHALRSVVVPGRGDEVITFAPFFPEYHYYVGGTGAKLVVVPADITSFQINFEAFESLINENTRAVLINTPNNPSGIVYSTATIDRLAEILNRKQKEYGHSIYIISDEPYRELVFSGTDAPFVANHYDNTMVCYSFSKALSLPGERIGYIAINTEAEDYPIAVPVFGQISREIGHNCPASLIQQAVSEVLDLTSDLSVYETNCNILYDALTSYGYEIVRPGGTFYMFPKCLEADAYAFCEKAKKYDLLLVPSDNFGTPGHFRIAYCVTTEKVERSLPLFKKLAQDYGVI